VRFKELLFTGFYSGYIPYGPGTAGTLVAMIIFILEYFIFKGNSWIINIIIVAVLFIPSLKLADDGAKFFKKKDPSQVVIDEMIGYWITVMFFPFSLKLAIIAFIIFRIFDILKPYPISYFEKFKGGTGIMLDDFVAGLFSWIIIYLLGVVQIFSNIEILYSHDVITKLSFYKVFL
jgi:phosphatidylglycerophosphatase A